MLTNIQHIYYLLQGSLALTNLKNVHWLDRSSDNLYNDFLNRYGFRSKMTKYTFHFYKKTKL